MSRGVKRKYEDLETTDEQCHSCEQVIEIISKYDTEIIIPVELPLSVLYHRNKNSNFNKEERKIRSRLSDKLCRCIGALRNSKGGHILIHIPGLSSRDKYLGIFDEFIEKDLKLHTYCEDLFVESYERHWLCDEKFQPVLKDYIGSINRRENTCVHEFIVLNVKASSKVCTSKFCTKLPLDNSIQDPTTEELVNFIRKARQFTSNRPTIRGLDSLTSESRHIQVKRFRKPHFDAETIWHDLRLGEYISAFSKVAEGGSYFVGVEENDKEHEFYATKKLEVYGIQSNSTDLDRLRNSIQRFIKDNILVCDYSGNQCTTDGLVETEVHRTSGNFVIEFAVKPVSGLVFTNKQGPKSYQFSTADRIESISLQQWFKWMKKK